MARGKKKSANSTALTDPETRKEIFMAKAAGLIESAPSVPYTREERYWLAIIEAINRGGAGDMKIEDYDPNGVVAEAGGIPAYVRASGGGFIPENNAGAHNAIYRGKYLGNSVTVAQYDAIDAGTFEDLFIGDYWTINDVNWRIAAFDYYLRTGHTECISHHIVIVPDTPLSSGVMNENDTTDGGYTGSYMYNTELNAVKQIIENAFGSGHILEHYFYLVNSVTNGVPSSEGWGAETVVLMTEANVFGSRHYGVANNGTVRPSIADVDNSQFPLFLYNPMMKSNRNTFWLRDIVSAERFAYVGRTGIPTSDTASGAYGIRPSFSIKK